MEIPSAATSEVVLEVKKLNHSFGETIVAKDIDFQCRKGEVIALIGPNGTGKSTIGRILFYSESIADPKTAWERSGTFPKI